MWCTLCVKLIHQRDVIVSARSASAVAAIQCGCFSGIV